VTEAILATQPRRVCSQAPEKREMSCLTAHSAFVGGHDRSVDVFCRHCAVGLRRFLGRWWHLPGAPRGPVPCPGAEPEPQE